MAKLLANWMLSLVLLTGSVAVYSQPYELCKGMWSGTLTAAGASRAPAEAKELVTWSPPGSQAPLFPTSPKKIEKAFPSFDLRVEPPIVARKLKELAVPEEVWGHWYRARDALGRLPSSERQALLQASGVSEALNGLGQGDADLHKFSEQLQRVTMRSELATLGKSMDPKTIEAYRPEQGDPSSLSAAVELHDSALVRALAISVVKLSEKAGVRSRLNDGNVFMVAGGEPGRPGGLGAVPSGQPVAFDVSENGRRCLRPAVKADWQINPVTKLIGRAWDPQGFGDIGMLLWRVRQGASSTEKPGICSFIRVSPGHLLTAGHCVISSGQGEPVKLRTADEKVEIIALLPRIGQIDPKPSQCFEDPQNCGYWVATVREAPQFPSAVSWPRRAAAPSPDVALLGASFAGAGPVATGIGSTSDLVSRLTVAGYGLNDATGKRKLGELLLGWQQYPPKLEKTTLLWSVDLANGAVAACGGDSGGPVFQGDIAGTVGETHLLKAVVSFGRFTQGDGHAIESCRSSISGTAERIDIHRQWLCEKTNNIVMGCPGKPVVATR